MTADRMLLFEDSLLVAAPTLLAWEWAIRLAHRRYTLSAIVVTVSCVWILLARVWRSVIGPDYSNAHAYIVIANILALIAVAIATLFVRSQRSPRILLAALSLAFVWFVALAIMYAV